VVTGRAIPLQNGENVSECKRPHIRKGIQISSIHLAAIYLLEPQQQKKVQFYPRKGGGD
jgi:hypothetical protein